MFLIFLISSCNIETLDKSSSATKTLNATTETRANGSSCAPEIDDNNCDQFYNVVSVVNWGNCDWTVKYSYQLCPSGLQIWGFKIISYGSGITCQNMMEIIDEAINNNDLIALRDAYNLLYGRLSLELEKNLIATFPSGDHQCAELTLNITAEFIASACIQLCILAKNGNNFPLEEAECGLACCKRTSVWCYTGTTPTKLFTINGENGSGNTPVCTIPEFSKCGAVSTPCQSSCNRVYQ